MLDYMRVINFRIIIIIIIIINRSPRLILWEQYCQTPASIDDHVFKMPRFSVLHLLLQSEIDLPVPALNAIITYQYMYHKWCRSHNAPRSYVPLALWYFPLDHGFY